MLRNSDGGGGVSNFPEKALERCKVQRYLALRGGGGVQFPRKKRYVTLEWPLRLERRFL